ncbi:uncharacterized protein LOC133007535 [Limanda limanda]|uniref:uncharacterized protein LOC133007535 n=1 Tax=Limanda limanda TaxID=27771 RepID=UPI0029C89745|nr:uncharacterized protein LOC133007535 [Limanda limanda]
MAASPFSFSADRFWTEEKEKTLICFFSKHSCLWNHRSESYKSRKLRWRTLEQLRVILSTLPPPNPFTVEDIKNKFKNLRTTFRRQYKLVRASRVCRLEHVFEPQWKHYEQLMFLQGCWETDAGVEEEQPLQTPPQEEAQVISSLPNTPTSFPSTSSNMQLRCHWTEETERALISFYCEHSCLWNKKSENHNNRQHRQRLLETLRAKLSDRSVAFTVEDIKNKFKNLRTVFKREFKAVHASRASDKPLVSKWKHYQQLLFLGESCDEDDATDDLQALAPQDDKDVEPGNRTPSSTLSSVSSGSAHTNSIMVGNASAPTSSAQSNARTVSGAGSQILLLASPDNLKLSNQTAALPTSPSASPTDTKPCTSSSPLSSCVSVPVESDGRASADPRCHWSEAKVQQLIAFYSERSCLWTESYRNRVLRQSQLEALSGLMSHNESAPFTVDDIKAKFRNLRTIFQREHKAVSSNRTCGSEDFYVPKWKHYRDLMFLCDCCDEDERPEDVPQPQESRPLHLDSQATPPRLLYHAASQTAAELNVEAPPSPTPPDSRHSSPSSSPPPSTPSSHTSSRGSGRKRAAPTTGTMLDLMRTLCQSQAVSPHAGFLKYVEECLNETPPGRVKKLKKQIIETLHGASEEA